MGGLRRNLQIVSWVTPTLGCSQPLILRPFGRYGEELPVEYQVEQFFYFS
jgi:hypothetical protein